MISEKMFEEIMFYQKSLIPERFPIQYETYKTRLQEFISHFQMPNMQGGDDLQNDLSFIFAAAWTGFAGRELKLINRSSNTEDTMKHVAFFTLSDSISDYILSISHLLSMKMKLQANSLLRNLYELCILLLAILIDDTLLEHYIDLDDSERESKRWRKYFSSGKLMNIIRKWEATKERDLQLRISNPYEDNYSFLSSYVHNAFVAIINSKFVRNNDNQFTKNNIWGTTVNNIETTQSIMFSLLLYLNYAVQVLVESNTYTIRNISDIKLNEYEDKDHVGYCYFFSCAKLFYSHLLISSVSIEDLGVK